jgi:hypothetical protein
MDNNKSKSFLDQLNQRIGSYLLTAIIVIAIFFGCAVLVTFAIPREDYSCHGEPLNSNAIYVRIMRDAVSRSSVSIIQTFIIQMIYA